MEGLLKSLKNHPFATGAYSCLLFFERVVDCCYVCWKFCLNLRFMSAMCCIIG